MLESLRGDSGLIIFRPVEDLTAFAQSAMGARATLGGTTNELENSVIRVRIPISQTHMQNRNGTVLVSQTILKVDHWSSEMVTRSIISGVRFCFDCTHERRRISDISLASIYLPWRNRRNPG
jgi:hypothetical protein